MQRQRVQHPHRSVHSDRIERWLGTETCNQLSQHMRGWYGAPIAVDQVHGRVYVDKQGDFVGRMECGQFASFEDHLDEMQRQTRQRERARFARATKQGGGFSTANAARSFTGHQRLNVLKDGAVANFWASCWGQATLPIAGAVGGAAPGGTVPTSASTGAIGFVNPTVGTTHYLGSEMLGPANSGMALLYDRIFAVAKTMNSTATEAVTGVPTRYQSTTMGAENSAENNFLHIATTTVLPATAHNWTVCTYTDQSGNVGATLPSVTGVSACAANRLDQTPQGFWCPLATGDTGIQALTQMQCSALVATGAIDFVLGHPIAWIPMWSDLRRSVIRDERINSALNFARIFNDACLALLCNFTNSTSNISGTINLGSA